MTTRLQALEAEALRLSPKARAKLVERIILSLESSLDTELERTWAEEAERRVGEIRKGLVRARPAAAVFQRIRRQVSRKRSRSIH
jgi:putative addiction module component (TIGR02574 family)